jgi:hypothetical protein
MDHPLCFVGSSVLSLVLAGPLRRYDVRPAGLRLHSQLREKSQLSPDVYYIIVTANCPVVFGALGFVGGTST